MNARRSKEIPIHGLRHTVSLNYDPDEFRICPPCAASTGIIARSQRPPEREVPETCFGTH